MYLHRPLKVCELKILLNRAFDSRTLLYRLSALLTISKSEKPPRGGLSLWVLVYDFMNLSFAESTTTTGFSCMTMKTYSAAKTFVS